MAKIVELKKEYYEEFVKTHKTKSHFLQSYEWGEFSRLKKNLTPFYIGLLDDKEKIIGASLLLKKSLPLGFCYFYAPRGFVIDYTDEALFKLMTDKIITFAKSKKAIFVKIDPDIIRKSYNYDNKENDLLYDSDKIFKMITRSGFRHQGFTKNFETMQPRFTFRINLDQSLEDIESHFSKTTKQRISKSIKLNTEVNVGTEKDLDEFYHLMTLTEDRKDFVSYSKDYYKTLYKVFNESDNSKATLFMGKVNFSKMLKGLEVELKTINNQISILPIDNLSKSAKNKLKELKRQKDNLQTEITKYEEYEKKYGKEVTLNAHMIIEYGDKAWVLYAGNHNILTETYANYHTYYEHIKYCKDKGYKIYDQFGTIGDLKKDNPRLGLHEFKKKFGGDYVEFLGEFDYITNPFMYFVFTKIVPVYRKLIRNKAKKEIKNEVNRDK